jgi:hypothetical protein
VPIRAMIFYLPEVPLGLNVVQPNIYFLNALQDQLANLAQLVICNDQWRCYAHAVCCKQEPIGDQPVLYALMNDGLVDLSG